MLKQWFFWQHPELQQVADFVCERIALNTCNTIRTYVPDIVEVLMMKHSNLPEIFQVSPPLCTATGGRHDRAGREILLLTIIAVE